MSTETQNGQMDDKEDGGAVACSEGDICDTSSKGVKRPAEDDHDENVAKKQETEASLPESEHPTDDTNTFRLNPPTLIHGVAKPAPKHEGEDSSEAKEKPLLRPSLFSGGGANPFMQIPFKSLSSMVADSTSEDPTDAGPRPAENQTARGDLHPFPPPDKPKMNFLKLSSGDTDRDVGFGVFGTFTDSHLHRVNFSAEKGAPGQNGDEQNYFLQFSQVGSKPSKEEEKPIKEEPESKEEISSSEKERLFVFGENMNARVTSPGKQEGELLTAAQYVFGENLSDRMKQEEPPPPTESRVSPEQSSKSLAENAKELETAKERSRIKFEEVELVTGEEGEENVLQAQCKLHLFQSEKQTWVERGRGLLRLNDRVPSDYAAQMESRIVMRAQGSLRVLLNSKIWLDMIAEKVNTKNIRISAIDTDSGNVRIYLITATPNDAEHIYQGIEYRIKALRQRQEADNASESKKEDPYQTEDPIGEPDSYEGSKEAVPEMRHDAGAAAEKNTEDSSTGNAEEVTSSSVDAKS